MTAIYKLLEVGLLVVAAMFGLRPELHSISLEISYDTHWEFKANPIFVICAPPQLMQSLTGEREVWGAAMANIVLVNRQCPATILDGVIRHEVIHARQIQATGPLLHLLIKSAIPGFFEPADISLFPFGQPEKYGQCGDLLYTNMWVSPPQWPGMFWLLVM